MLIINMQNFPEDRGNKYFYNSQIMKSNSETLQWTQVWKEKRKLFQSAYKSEIS